MPDRWKTIEWPNGPYIPALDINNNDEPVLLINKNTDEYYDLTPEEQKIAMLFASKLIDKDQAKEILSDDIYIHNFWSTFNHPSDMTFEDVDWEEIIDHIKIKQYEEQKNEAIEIKKIRDRRDKHGTIIVDGIKQIMNVYSVSPASIYYGSKNDPQRGIVKRGILPKDITLNLSFDLPHPHPEYNWKGIIEDKEELWVAKWNDPLTGENKYIEVTPFEIHEEEEKEEEEEEEEKEIIGYDEPEEEYEDSDEDSDNKNSEDTHWRHYMMTELKQKPMLPEETMIDFLDLSKEEKEYLPLSFLLNNLDQWYIMEKACKSGFKVVNDMDKVVDKHLKTFVDAAIYAVTKKGITSPTHYAIINYGYQRKLF